MKNFKYSLIFLFLVFCCANENQSIKKISKSFRLQVIDSISIHHPNLYFQDLQKNNLLLCNFINFDVGIFDIENNDLSIFNKQGNLYDEYSYIYPETLKFVNDSTVGLTDRLTD